MSNNNTVQSYRAISLFSGAGGMDLGFISAGFKVVWANDIDCYACDTYRHNIGDHVHYGSLEDVDFETLPRADLVFGGPPCQGFSVAGKMDPHDKRSKLVWVFFDFVKTVQPKYFVMENVPALGRLEKFSSIRNELRDAYQEIGYRTQLQILNSKNFETPQSRERMFLIGTRTNGPIQFPEPYNREISTREAIADLDQPGEGINTGVCKAKITVAQNPDYRRSPYAGKLFNGLGRPIDLDKPAPTLIASMGGNRTPIIEVNVLRDPESPSWVKWYHALVASKKPFNALEINVPSDLRRLTVRECARIHGFLDSFEFSGPQSQQFKQIGNAVPPRLAFHVATSVLESLRGTVKSSSYCNWRL
jgi:DNA (cytosine-5)-methyltransferase 1